MLNRLVTSPVFILSPPRSGSTLLRCILGSHSALHAPHELHLSDLRVVTSTRMGRWSLGPLGLDTRETEHLLWDRLLHWELTRSGKRTIVEKTPQNVFIADRLAACWPDARFVYLLRHPGQVISSADAAARGVALATRLRMGAGFLWDGLRFGWANNPITPGAQLTQAMRALEAARQARPGFTIRYEELTARPAPTIHGLCDYLGIPFEDAMLAYGDFDHGPFTLGIGDWRDKIHSGRIQPAAPPPALAETPRELRDLCHDWGYAGSRA